jgi:hypothetical protein
MNMWNALLNALLVILCLPYFCLQILLLEPSGKRRLQFLLLRNSDA